MRAGLDTKNLFRTTPGLIKSIVLCIFNQQDFELEQKM